MNSVVLVFIAAALGAGVLWRMRRRPAAGAACADSGIPAGKEESYQRGLHPAEDGVPVMYTLTTCRHCDRLKDFLDKNGIAHNLVYVDDFTGPARSAVMGVLRGHNPRGSFPTMVLPGGASLVGFRENETRAAFHLPPTP